MKTFIPTLIFIVMRICRYTTRYDVQLRKNLPEAALPAYDALRTACDGFIAIATALGID